MLQYEELVEVPALLLVPQQAAAEQLASGAVVPEALPVAPVSVAAAELWHLFEASELAAPLLAVAAECVTASPCCPVVLVPPACLMYFKSHESFPVKGTCFNRQGLPCTWR